MIDRYIWEFAFWIRQTYGRVGCAVALAMMISLLAPVFVLLNRLPEPKTSHNGLLETKGKL